jgi:hypothetical protein
VMIESSDVIWMEGSNLEGSSGEVGLGLVLELGLGSKLVLTQPLSYYSRISFSNPNPNPRAFWRSNERR